MLLVQFAFFFFFYESTIHAHTRSRIGKLNTASNDWNHPALGCFAYYDRILWNYEWSKAVNDEATIDKNCLIENCRLRKRIFVPRKYEQNWPAFVTSFILESVSVGAINTNYCYLRMIKILFLHWPQSHNISLVSYRKVKRVSFQKPFLLLLFISSNAITISAHSSRTNSILSALSTNFCQIKSIWVPTRETKLHFIVIIAYLFFFFFYRKVYDTIIARYVYIVASFKNRQLLVYFMLFFFSFWYIFKYKYYCTFIRHRNLVFFTTCTTYSITQLLVPMHKYFIRQPNRQGFCTFIRRRPIWCLCADVDENDRNLIKTKIDERDLLDKNTALEMKRKIWGGRRKRYFYIV